MIKKLFLAIFCAIFALGLNAQLLWKISGNGLKQPSYIFGTHHVAPLSLLDSIKGLNDALNSCSQMYGEVDMADMAGLQAQSAKYVMAPQDSMLNVLFTPEEFKLIGDVVKKYMNADVNQMIMLKPAALTASISIFQAAQTFEGFDPNKQLDATIQTKFRERNINPKGLETAEFQFNLLFNDNLKDQAQDLLELVKDESKTMDFSRKLAKLYMAQDINGMFKLMQEPGLGLTEAKAKKLLYSRNHNWAKQLPEIMKSAPTFVAVGAGHLPGDEGVLNLLKKLGYKVTPVK